MKKAELVEILTLALKGQNGSYKFFGERDEKIAKLLLSSLDNIAKHYVNKYENLGSESIKYNYNVADTLTPSKKYIQKSKKLNKDVFNKKMSIILQQKIVLAADKYMDIDYGRFSAYVSFKNMPQEKLEKLEEINAFFEKRTARDEKETELEINNL